MIEPTPIHEPDEPFSQTVVLTEDKETPSVVVQCATMHFEYSIQLFKGFLFLTQEANGALQINLLLHLGCIPLYLWEPFKLTLILVQWGLM